MVDAFRACSYTARARVSLPTRRTPLLLQPRTLIAFLCALTALAVPASAFGSEQMYMGAAEDEGRNADPAVAMAKMARVMAGVLVAAMATSRSTTAG